MSVARTARRRRKQYAGGYTTLKALFGPKAAPHYKKRSSEVLSLREARFREKARLMMARGKKK